MEGDEREEGDPPRVSRSTAKRARKVSLVDNAEASEVGISNDFLQKAKIIQENLRIYLTKADKSIKNKDQNHINGKIQWFIDAIESLEERTKQYKDKSEGLSLLVHKAVQETLTSPSVHSMITSIVIEKTVPKVIESLSGTTMKSNGPLAIPGKSNEKSSATNVTPPEPLPAAVPFTVVKSKRNRKKTKKSTGPESLQTENETHKTEAESLTGSGPNQPKSLAEIVRKLPLKPTQSLKPAFITISGTGKSPVDIINALPSPTEIGVKAEIVRATKGGSVLVRLEDSTHATKIIGWQGLREKGFQAKLAQRKKPKIEVRGVPHSWGSAELTRFLWGRINEKSVPTTLINDDIRPLLSSVSRNGLSRNWVLEVHPMVRFQLLEMAALDGGWWSMTFKDYLDAPRCTKCQGYGHTKATCTVDTVVCIWCAANGHILKDCPRKKEQTGPTCINCVRASAPQSQTKHKAGSRECPVHLRWSNEVAKRTYYE